tara:strand:- start:163 stop:423 length:261 start_codon:yes stop_codon:yes gene_type:complete
MKFDTKSEYIETEITIKDNVHKIACHEELFDTMCKSGFQNADYIDVIRYQWAMHMEMDKESFCFDEEWSDNLLKELDVISGKIRYL